MSIVLCRSQASTSKSKIAPPEEIIKQAKIAKAKAGSRSKETGDSSSSARKSSKKDKKQAASSNNVADVSTASAVSPSKVNSKRKQIEAAKPSKRRRDSIDDTTDASNLIHESLLNASVDGSDDDDVEDSEDDGQPLVHESLLLGLDGATAGKYSSAGLQPRAKKQAKHLNESKTDRDARTTFVGNVPVACATSKVSSWTIHMHALAAPE